MLQEDIEKEVKTLLDLKQQYKDLTGECTRRIWYTVCMHSSMYCKYVISFKCADFLHSVQVRIWLEVVRVNVISPNKLLLAVGKAKASRRKHPKRSKVNPHLLLLQLGTKVKSIRQGVWIYSRLHIAVVLLSCCSAW